METATETVKQISLPYIIMNGKVAYPGIPLTLDIDRGAQAERRSLENAAKTCGNVLLVCRKPALPDNVTFGEIYGVGTVAQVKQLIKTQNGLFRIIAEPTARAEVLAIDDDKKQYATVLQKTVTEAPDDPHARALLREIRRLLDDFTKYMPKFSKDFWFLFESMRTVGEACDFVAENLLPDLYDKLSVLEEFDPCTRAERLILILDTELMVMEERIHIKEKVENRMKESQRDFFLREQLKAIHEELGDSEEDIEDDDIREYTEKLNRGTFPDVVRRTLQKEIKRLSRMPFGSAENTVARNYIEVCLEVPYIPKSKERMEIDHVQKILDEDHDGLEKVKGRIIEYLAALKLNPDLRGQIICLVGPPGTGKTSIAKSIARAVHRRFVRVSLGGVHDEAEIRGHRKTYIGAMPGRIINALIEARTCNPLILLDEIDKMGSDMRGDPASAMLEVLDREQNKTFRDNFLEIPVDLSNCMFITTANSLDGIPRPLLDRMEIIELHAYTRQEKFDIAKHHLVKKQMEKHGLTSKTFRMDNEVIYEMIDCYTREAGVRNLERAIEKCCRRAAKIISCGEQKSVHLTLKKLGDFMGEPKMLRDKISETDEIGIVNGMAWTELGGDLLRIEAMALPGTGKLELTGSLGDVMKESARAAISYIRRISPELGIAPDFYKTNDIHIHVPEGAVPKDGPSAGVTMVTALVSEFCHIPVRRDIAMTGEITLHGKVTAIGGLREKTMAAMLAGVRTILIPKENESDIKEISEEVKAVTEIRTVSSAEEVLKTALVRNPFDNKTVKEEKNAQLTECRA